MRKAFLSGLFLVLAASSPSAQDAEAKLYTKVEDGVVRAAVHVVIDPGAHLYHGPTKADLGHPNAVGKPTTATFTGGGVEWTAVRFPKPFLYPQDEFGKGTFILCHEDEIVLYAAGTPSEEADTDAIGAELDGLVCDDVACMPWKRSIETEGEGPEEVWEDWPADLVAPAEPSAPVAAEPAAPAQEPFRAKRDQHGGGEADATLFTRPDPKDPKKLRAAIRVELSEGWHLYYKEKGNPKGIGEPTVVTLSGEDVVWGELRWPEPVTFDQSDILPDTWILGYEDDFVLYAEGTLQDTATGRDASAVLVGQTCAAVCVTYKETVYTQGPGPDSVWADWDAAAARGATSPSTGGSDPESDEETPLVAFLLEAVLWGLITLLMPCTYPMIPITISFFTKQADARGGRVLPLSLAYGAGIVLIFALIGAVVGPAIVPFAQGGWLNLVIGLLFFYFALVLLGYVDLQPPRFLMNLAGKASAKGGFLGVFLMGTCLVVTSFTCTAPFVGTLLGRGAVGGDLSRVLLGMSVFGLTMAIPFVALSLVPGKVRALPRSGAWMNTLKVTLGFVEIAAAFKFLSNADIAWNWRVLSREVFLGLWVLIFLAAGLYLFGVIVLKGQRDAIGGKRKVVAALFVAFAAYCGWGLAGNKMDYVMDTMNPNYSGGLLFPPLYDFGGDWALVEDDLERAIELAKKEDKLVFINFTGHT